MEIIGIAVKIPHQLGSDSEEEVNIVMSEGVHFNFTNQGEEDFNNAAAVLRKRAIDNAMRVR